MDRFQVYKDIEARTNGEIYIGVVGPVRTGKSTFIKRFMDVLVLPEMKDEHARMRTQDELPQSASGRTIMTTEPKFVPKEAAKIRLADDVDVKVRLIDCVGYMVEGAAGYMDGDSQRQVKTPWFAYEIPFAKAAGIGTRKVIHDHSTIGIVITTDGTITDIPRENYKDAERMTIQELNGIGKPFIVLVNSKEPQGERAQNTAKNLEQEYGVRALPVNCEKLTREDICQILSEVLFEFPISEIQFFVPKWVEMLPRDHKIKQDLIEHVRVILERLTKIRDALGSIDVSESEYIDSCKVDQIGMGQGCVNINISIPERYYYEMLSEMTGTKIAGQYELVATIQELAKLKEEYEGVRDAFTTVRMKGYGVVSPVRDEITLLEPELIKQGYVYLAQPPLYKIEKNKRVWYAYSDEQLAAILGEVGRDQNNKIQRYKGLGETEIAPIVGTEDQAKDLLTFIKQEAETEHGIWETNIFGKSVEELVMDGIRGKIAMIGDESQTKLQDTMQKIVNDSNGGLVCIII